MIKSIFKIIMNFSLIIAISMIPGCATTATGEKRPERDAEDRLVERVIIEVDRGNMARALQIYEAGNGQDPLLHAVLLIKNRQLDKAESILSEVLRKDGSNITALYYTSLIYNSRGDSENEKKVLQRIIILDADNPDVNVALGRIYMEEKNYSRAESLFKKVISPNNYIEEAVLGHAMVLLIQGKNDEALAQFNTVIENNPNNMIAYAQRARIKATRDDYRGAERDLDEAIRIDSDYMWNYFDRGRARLYNGRFGSAAEDFTKVLSYDDSIFMAYIHRAQANEGMGRDNLALADYKKALEIREDYRRGFVPYALQLYRAGQWTEAAIYFINAYNIDASPEYLLLGAVSLIHANEKEMARKLITDNMNKIPRDNLFHHIARMYIDPPYETMVLNRLRDETDSFDAMQGMFYIAIYYDTIGKNVLSERYYIDIINSDFPESLEHKVANWKLQKK